MKIVAKGITCCVYQIYFQISFQVSCKTSSKHFNTVTFILYSYDTKNKIFEFSSLEINT